MRKITKTDFSVRLRCRGQWTLTYTSPFNGKKWTRITNDSELIDNLNDDNVKMSQKNLNSVKWGVKNYE